MKFLFGLLYFGLVFLSAPVFAQGGESAIKVIQEDGSVEVLEIPSTPVRTPLPQSPLRVLVPEEVPPTPPPQIEKEAILKVPDPEPLPEAEPKQEAAVEPAKAPLPTKRPAVSKKKTVKPAGKIMPEKLARPSAPRTLEIPPGTVIDRDLALRIALEHAPPASGFDVTLRTYNDRPVYQAVFKTENGPYIILVDQETGKVLKEK